MWNSSTGHVHPTGVWAWRGIENFATQVLHRWHFGTESWGKSLPQPHSSRCKSFPELGQSQQQCKWLKDLSLPQDSSLALDSRWIQMILVCQRILVCQWISLLKDSKPFLDVLFPQPSTPFPVKELIKLDKPNINTNVHTCLEPEALWCCTSPCLCWPALLRCYFPNSCHGLLQVYLLLWALTLGKTEQKIIFL